MLPFLKRLFRFRPNTVVQRSTNLAALWLRGADDPPPITLTNSFTQSAWIYACVSAIAQQVAHTPLRFSVGKAQGEQVLESGPLVDLFNHPHPQLDRFLFWDLIVSWLLLRGKAFVVGLDRQGNVSPINPATILPKQFLILNPDRLTKVVGGHQLLGYRFQASHSDLLESQHLLPEDVLCLRLANPFDACDGHSPATVASLAAQTDFAAAQFMKGLIINNADSGLIVTSKEPTSPETREQILAMLRERKRSAGTADRPLFLSGDVTVEKPSISMVDFQFLENRKFSRQEICAIYKTPQEILGFTEDSNRAVAEAVRLNWIENTIAPLCERLAAAFTPMLNAAHLSRDGVPRSSGAALRDGLTATEEPRAGLCHVAAPGGGGTPQRVTAWFDLDALPIMQKARQDRFKAARQAFEMGVPVSVLNGLFDLGLPELPHGGVSFVPRTLVPVAAPRESAAVIPDSKTNAALSRDTATADKKELHLRSRLLRFFFEQRGRVLGNLEREASTLLDVECENLRLRSLIQPFIDGETSLTYLADINDTTLQQLNEALQANRADPAGGVRAVFRQAAKQRVPMLARLLSKNIKRQP